MSVFLQPVGIVIGFALLSIHTDAMVCQMGQEPDSNSHRKYRWVIPVEDPCKCTKIRPGGINNRTPGRHFKVIYFYAFSNSPKEIRKWLNCSDAFLGNQVKTTSIPAVNKSELTGSVPASQSVIITTQATGNEPATSDIPVTSFTCEEREDGGHYADPDNCTMFYQCGNGAAHHMTCPDGTHFNESVNVCVHLRETNCNL